MVVECVRGGPMTEEKALQLEAAAVQAMQEALLEELVEVVGEVLQVKSVQMRFVLLERRVRVHHSRPGAEVRL